MNHVRRAMAWGVMLFWAVSACKTSDEAGTASDPAGSGGAAIGGAPTGGGASGVLGAESGAAGAAATAGDRSVSGPDGMAGAGGEPAVPPLTTNCADSPKPKSGGAVGTVTGTQPNAIQLLPTSGVAASILVKEGVHQLFVRLTDYANACDYFSLGLGKQSASEADILLDTGADALAIGSYHSSRRTSAPGKTATIALSPALDGSRCAGDLFAYLPDGTIEVTALDGQHVALNIDLQASAFAFTGQVDAPLCSGPQKCGCAP